MDVPIDRSMPFFSYRERITIALGIAVIIFSALGLFVGTSNIVFICLMTLCLVSVMVVQQVKALRSTAATLHESEERFRLLVNEVQDYAIFVASPDYNIVSWNSGAERITGYKSTEIVGRPFCDLRATETVQKLATTAIFKTAQSTGRYKEEAWYKAKDGRRFLTNTVITPLLTHRNELRGFGVVMWDITAKKQAERDLLESYRFIERITHTIPNILFIIDALTLKKIYINEEVAVILGYTSEDLARLGPEFFDSTLHPEDKTTFEFLRERSKTMRDGEIVEVDCRMKHAVKDWRWLSCRIVVFTRSLDGTPQQFLGVGQDITDLKQAQEETRLLEKTALARQRLALLGELSAGVAHEIRNPLQGILSCVEELRSQCSSNETLVPTIELLEDGLQRMDHISSRLLHLARNHDGAKTLTDVAQCVEGTCAFLRTRAQKSGIALRVEIEPDLPLVPMHAERVSEALLNLINNAMDACETGGRVTLSAFRSKESECLELRVVDTGSGIPPEARDRIFETFFTTKAPGKGTGLGMTIVKKNAEAHGGKVELVNTSTSGTTFRMLIPLV